MRLKSIPLGFSTFAPYTWDPLKVSKFNGSASFAPFVIRLQAAISCPNPRISMAAPLYGSLSLNVAISGTRSALKALLMGKWTKNRALVFNVKCTATNSRCWIRVERLILNLNVDLVHPMYTIILIPVDLLWPQKGFHHECGCVCVRVFVHAGHEGERRSLWCICKTKSIWIKQKGTTYFHTCSCTKKKHNISYMMMIHTPRP